MSNHFESDLQLLADRAERLEYIVRGSQFTEDRDSECQDMKCKDLTTRINELSVKLREIPSTTRFGESSRFSAEN
jgi:hypothetical protein